MKRALLILIAAALLLALSACKTEDPLAARAESDRDDHHGRRQRNAL